ncbi:MAG: GNAT family N-acetyltransferase [Proteobacteria bacterium]|nr:GNAT family N-acetyltransferase [Pseudomonadota bacterium]MBU1584944.1 GNAT family N-acetyltransferase [Pseudomonadota bacterium]MBU2627742.1 GNAT family N-acetyltransferase [Pseudomonadota bacterium]
MEDLVEDTVNIREITLNDAQAIQQIRKAISEDDAEVNFVKIIEQQISDGGGKSSLVAEINKDVIGYMITTTLYAGFGIKKSAWIVAIGVHPDYMGQGVGMKLAERICQIYKEKGVKYIYSSVIWDSTDVLSFFKKLGFERSEFINLKKKL